MSNLENPKFSKAKALKLIQGVDDAKKDWKNFKKFTDDQVDPALKIDKRSVIIALIIEASDLTFKSDTEDKQIKAVCENFQKKTVSKVLKKLSDRERDLINKKYNSVRNLVSMATKVDKARKPPKDPCEPNTNTQKPEIERIGLSGKNYKELEPQLPAFLHDLSDDDFEALRRVVDVEYDARREQCIRRKATEHREVVG